MLEFLIDNVNIEVGNNVFRQRHELLEKLFLFYYECRYMRYLLKNNYQLARAQCGTWAQAITNLLPLP